MKWLIRSAICALMPRTEELPGAEDADIDAFLTQYLREVNTLTALGVYLGTIVFTLTPIFTVFVPLPSFLLPAKKLDQHAYRICTTRIYLLRQAVFVVKLVAGLCWGAHPAVRQRLQMAPYPQDPGTYRSA